MRHTRADIRAVLVGFGIVAGLATQAAAQDGRYIVKFNPGRGAAGQAAVRGAGGQVLLVLDPQNAVAARIPAAALNGLSRNPNIEYIEDDVLREPYAQTTPYGVTQSQASKIDASNGTPKTVCIIDSGYAVQHEDLKNSANGANNGGSGSWNVDSCGHGSHVAGTVAAIDNNAGVVGVNPAANLFIVKVFGNDAIDGGACGWTYSSTLVNALNVCVANGANVINMSLGGSFRSRTEDQAFSNAYKNNVLSIAAAGNAGNNTTSYPAGYASVVSVAAVDSTETVAGFSQKNKDVELAAAGVGVLSTVPWNQSNTLTVGQSQWSGGWIEGAARTSGTTGTIANGGLCNSAGPWPSGAVVLCQRGSNSFADKVANVKAGGGAAAVVYNNISSDSSCGVFSGTLNGTSTIPAIALSCADGAAALGTAGSPGTVVSSIVYVNTDPLGSGYEAWDGTSMATPHVSGVAALIWACNPTASAAAVRDALDKSALDKGAAGRDSSYGFGIVQAASALTRLGNAAGCTIIP